MKESDETLRGIIESVNDEMCELYSLGAKVEREAQRKEREFETAALRKELRAELEQSTRGHFDAVKRERDEAVKDNERLIKERDQARRERDQARHELKGVRSAASRNLATAIKDLKALRDAYDDVVKERDQARRERDAALANKDNVQLAKELAFVTRDRDEARADNVRLANDNKHLNQRNDATLAELKGVRSAHDRSARHIEALARDLQAARESRDKLTKELETARAGEVWTREHIDAVRGLLRGATNASWRHILADARRANLPLDVWSDAIDDQAPPWSSHDRNARHVGRRMKEALDLDRLSRDLEAARETLEMTSGLLDASREAYDVAVKDNERLTKELAEARAGEVWTERDAALGKAVHAVFEAWHTRPRGDK